jgi:hypothetical protein
VKAGAFRGVPRASSYRRVLLLDANPAIAGADSATVIINVSFGQTFTTFFPITSVLFHIKAATWLALDDCGAVLFY